MKLWSTEHIFSHPWKQVTEAAWRKYPNELNPNVHAIDVIDRRVVDSEKILTTRIFGTQWNLPKVITSLLGMPEMCYAIESSEVDMKNEKMTLKMINYTFWGMLAVEETLVYQPSKENPNETHLEQGAKIQINGIRFANYFEDVIVSNFETTSHKGRKALEQVLNKIQIEKIFTTVKSELNDISCDIDKTATFIDRELHIKERVQELSDDLDKAATLLNCEFQIFSTKIESEMKNLLNTLNEELHEITQKLVLHSNVVASGSSQPKLGLKAAVCQAGIKAKNMDS